ARPRSQEIIALQPHHQEPEISRPHKPGLNRVQSACAVLVMLVALSPWASRIASGSPAGPGDQPVTATAPATPPGQSSALAAQPSPASPRSPRPPAAVISRQPATWTPTAPSITEPTGAGCACSATPSASS